MAFEKSQGVLVFLIYFFKVRSVFPVHLHYDSYMPLSQGLVRAACRACVWDCGLVRNEFKFKKLAVCARFQRGSLLPGWFPIDHDDHLKWLVGMLEIFYLNKQPPSAPYNWLAHISCCLPWSITSDESDKAGAPLQCSISCTSSAAQGVMGRLCQQIYLSKFRPLSCDTCSNSDRDVTTVWKRGVSYWMTPLIYWWKRMRCQNKSGNRLEYIKWCGVSSGVEPILPRFF